MKRFSDSEQSVVTARCQRDETPNSSVIAETMKLLVNSPHVYQNKHRSQPSVTWYMVDEKTHAAVSIKIFIKTGHINGHLHKVELAKSEFQHKESLSLGFLILQNAELRKLELFYNFFVKNDPRDTVKYEEKEMDTDSLCLAIAEKELCDRKRIDKTQEWDLLRSRECENLFNGEACSKFFPVSAVLNKKLDKKEWIVPGNFSVN